MDTTWKVSARLARCGVGLSLIAVAVWGGGPVPAWFTIPWVVVVVGAFATAAVAGWLRGVNRRVDQALAAPLSEDVPGLPARHPVAASLRPTAGGALAFTAHHADGTPCSAECQARWQS